MDYNNSQHSTSNKKNIKMMLAYDGGHYLGWQESSSGPTIEGSLKKALEQILQEPVILQAASRTDAGVNAIGQVVNFFSSLEKTTLEKLHHSLNALLPNEIVVTSIEEAPYTFHPTLDARGKEYRYYVCYSKWLYPHQRHHTWHYPYPLNISLMKAAAQMLIGTHNFRAFCNVKKNETYTDYTRTLTTLEIEELPEEHLSIRIEGNAFLYKMVRNIVGTLVYVGRGLICLNDLPQIVENKKRKAAGMTAPAHALFLQKVHYTREKTYENDL